ncbi:hypothetical protein ACG873_00425 (plasmid) [Mesorhizobium sp. AaZ16]|uniref:hypothetical protein n=1 Tax=Mesorhizobium sp. AaZ16 TaxID=3402289 RepID=UPI00374F01C9
MTGWFGPEWPSSTFLTRQGEQRRFIVARPGWDLPGAAAILAVFAKSGEWIGSDRGLGALIIQATFNCHPTGSTPRSAVFLAFRFPFPGGRCGREL